MKKIGFIGMGNMASALAGGFISSGAIDKGCVFAYDVNKESLKKKADSIGFVPCYTVQDLSEADTLIIACKPHHVEGAIKDIFPLIGGRSILSVALGWDYAKYSEILPAGSKIQFIMPNTPALCGEGMFLFEQTNSLDASEREQVIKLFSSVGKVCELPSQLMGIGGVISGCGPAFADLVIEAFADAAVKYGIPRDTAYLLVSQTLMGSAKLQLETGTHPAVLKDAVCSPGGTTIRGVEALEVGGLRAACMNAVEAAMNRPNK